MLQGKKGLGEHVKYVDELAQFCRKEIKKRSPRLKLRKSDTTMIYFYYNSLQRRKNNSDDSFKSLP